MNLKLSFLSSILATLSTFKLTIFKLLYHVIIIVIDTFSFQWFSQGYPLHFESLCLPRLCLDHFLVHVVGLLLIVHLLFLFSLILFLVNFVFDHDEANYNFNKGHSNVQSYLYNPLLHVSCSSFQAHYPTLTLH